MEWALIIKLNQKYESLFRCRHHFRLRAITYRASYVIKRYVDGTVISESVLNHESLMWRVLKNVNYGRLDFMRISRHPEKKAM